MVLISREQEQLNIYSFTFRDLGNLAQNKLAPILGEEEDILIGDAKNGSIKFIIFTVSTLYQINPLTMILTKAVNSSSN